MKFVRIDRRTARREHSWHDDLPPGPLDPDVVQAKALARARESRHESTSRAARAQGQTKRAG